MMSESELGKLTVVSPSMPPLTRLIEVQRTSKEQVRNEGR